MSGPNTNTHKIISSKLDELQRLMEGHRRISEQYLLKYIWDKSREEIKQEVDALQSEAKAAKNEDGGDGGPHTMYSGLGEAPSGGNIDKKYSTEAMEVSVLMEPMASGSGVDSGRSNTSTSSGSVITTPPPGTFDDITDSEPAQSQAQALQKEIAILNELVRRHQMGPEQAKEELLKVAERYGMRTQESVVTSPVESFVSSSFRSGGGIIGDGAGHIVRGEPCFRTSLDDPAAAAMVPVKVQHVKNGVAEDGYAPKSPGRVTVGFDLRGDEEGEVWRRQALCEDWGVDDGPVNYVM